MAKAKFQYKNDDVVRIGEEITSYRNEADVGHYGIWARKFDTARGGMSPWISVSDITTDHSEASKQWYYYADHLRGEGALTAVFVNVLHWSPVDEKYANIGKYNCHAVALDVRSSNMLKGDGGVTRNTAPDAFDLHLAINRDFGAWLDSQDQSRDDAAKDTAHDTANGTPDPIPDNLTVPSETLVPGLPIGDTGSSGADDDHDESRHGNPTHEMGDSNGESKPTRKRRAKT